MNNEWIILFETFHNRLCIFYPSVRRWNMEPDKFDVKERHNKGDSIYGVLNRGQV